MAGLLGAAIAGGAEGAGTGAMLVGKEWTSLEHQKAKDEAQTARETNLELMREASAKDLQQGGFTHAENLQQQGFTHAERLQSQNQDFTKGENKLNRDLQTNLENLRQKSETDRHNETIKVQMAGIGVQQAQLRLAQNHVQLVPQADGSMVKMTSDGKVLGALKDDAGNVVYGTKDVAASTKILMEGNVKQMTAIESEIKSEMDPNVKQQLRGKIEFLQRSNERLASGLKPEAPEGPAVPQQALDALKKDPKLADQFDAKYGKGAAAKALKGGGGAAPAEAGQYPDSSLVQEPPGSNQPQAEAGNGLIARARARRAAEEERRAALKEKGAGYGEGY